MKLGAHLLSQGAVGKKMLQHALKAHRISQLKLGEYLCFEGMISQLQLYQALAGQHGMDFVNLREKPPSFALLRDEDHEYYEYYHYVPYKDEKGTLVIAVSENTDVFRKHVARLYGKKVRIVLATPRDISMVLMKRFQDIFEEKARLKLWQDTPHFSARELIFSRSISVLTLLAFILPLILLPVATIAFFAAMNVFYLFCLLFKAMIIGFGSVAKRHKAEEMIEENVQWPVYTLLVPMFREKEKTVSTLLTALDSMDYPKTKLDIKLILEEDDTATIDIVKKLKPKPYVSIVLVPYSEPRTKPKACNYALASAKGEMITIYDAEDIPDPKQLKMAVIQLKKSGDNTVCLQGMLNFWNREENLLTRLFSIEYAMWFELMLPGLEKLGLPIPLGGTSNHLPRHILNKIGAWDPFNVTEDADLGIRLSQLGYRTGVLHSKTMEEAPIRLGAWFKQRTRWMKGYMQTYLVHMRSPKKLLSSLGLRAFMGFQFFVGAPAVTYITFPAVLFIAFGVGFGQIDMPRWCIHLAWCNLFLGIVMHLKMAHLAISRNNWHNMLLSGVLFPFYWVLHSLASIRAAFQLVLDPHRWEKTDHAETSMNQPLSYAESVK